MFFLNVSLKVSKFAQFLIYQGGQAEQCRHYQLSKNYHIQSHDKNATITSDHLLGKAFRIFRIASKTLYGCLRAPTHIWYLTHISVPLYCHLKYRVLYRTDILCGGGANMPALGDLQNYICRILLQETISVKFMQNGNFPLV